MSDQSSLAPHSTRSILPEEISGHHFPTVRRGLDPEAVRHYLESLAGQLGALYQRERELLSALTEAERRATSPVLDEAALTSALGSETGRVLQVAHEAARDVVARAEARAQELVSDAEAAGEERRRVLEAETFMATARARAEADALVGNAKVQCQAMVDEARDARRRILSDLAERRRLLHVQLEQLRAGKDALTEVVDSVAHSVDQVRAQLQGSEEHVRAVAEDAGRYAVSELEDVLPDELISRALAAIDLQAGEQALEISVFEGELASVDADESLQETPSAPSEEAEAEQEDASSSVVDALFKRIRESDVEEEDLGESTTEPQSETDAAPAVEAEPIDPMLFSRSSHLDPATADLSRALKKIMRLEQNELLDALRHVEKGADGSALLPGEQMAARIAEACLPAIGEAYQAGGRFALSSLEGEASTDSSAPDTTEEAQLIASELGSEIAVSLSRRIEPAISGEENDGALPAAVGIAFRDWKGARAESVAADATTRAFSVAVLSVARARGTQLRWIVDDGESLCPECDDNSLAEDLRAGDAFPTGHSHPPIHPGCRCLIVPSLT